MATSATTTAAVFSSFSNTHVSGKGRRLGQSCRPLNSHAAPSSLSGSHQQRKRRRRQRKAAAAAERNKSETKQDSKNVIQSSKSNTNDKCKIMNRLEDKFLVEKDANNDEYSACQMDCNCGNISASLLASLVASPLEKNSGVPSSSCQSLKHEKSLSESHSIQIQSVSTTRHNKPKGYSCSAPLFGQPSSHQKDASTVTYNEINQSTNTNECIPEGSSIKPLHSNFSERVPLLINSPELQLRFLNPSDIVEVKRLCKEWFPIEYPDVWYTDITSNHKFYSVCAVYRGQIIGLIVAEIKEVGNLPKEDSEILAPDNICLSFFGTSGRRKSNQRLGYILSLGVVKEFRKNGIASFLLDNLVAHLTNRYNDPPTDDVRALYLHVLTTNSQAIAFYEHRGFRAHLFLPYYYAIKGRRRDGFTYVLYLNGGHPPWSLLDYAGHCLQATFYGIVTLQPIRRWLNFPVFVTRSLLRKLTGAAFAAAGGGGGNQRLAAAGGGVGYAINGANNGPGVWPRIRQIAHSSTAAVFTS